MATLSLAMIVKNEERCLGRVLEAAKQFCDELVIVDTGSTDRTVEIAKSYGAKVHEFVWIDDFAAARNHSFNLCSGDWILWLDADDLLPPETIEIGKRIKNELLDTLACDFVFTPYAYAKGLDGAPSVDQGRERFCRRSAKPRWVGRIHETVVECGNSFIKCPEFLVVHDTPEENQIRKEGRNLRIFEKYLDPKNLVGATTRECYLFGGELRGVGRFEDAVACYREYLRTWPAEDYDLFEEPYIVRIDLIETYRKLCLPRDAVRICADAIAYNGSRAEAYALLGMTHLELGNYACAYPALLAAAACREPHHGGLVYKAFYNQKALRETITYCTQKLQELRDAELANVKQAA